MRRLRCGKVLGERHGAERHLADDGAIRLDLFCQVSVFARVNAIDAGAHQRNCATAGSQRATMGGRVNALRQPGYDGDALACELRGQLISDIPAVFAGFARTNHGKAFVIFRLELTANVEQQRPV